jgi:hypothetical protein
MTWHIVSVNNHDVGSLPHNQRCIGSENLIQAIPMQAVLKLEALRDLVQLGLALPAEMFRPLLHKILGHENVARQPTDPVRHLPECRVERLVFRRDFLSDVVDQGLVDVLDPGGVRAPSVHGKTVFLGEKVLEERDVLGLLRDVDHALETDVFVQPDRPTQAVLRTSSVSDWPTD